MTTKRLEYIDALRGFIMILVVYLHIINFGYHIANTKMEAMDTFINLFIRFLMPLFFFISGFVLYKKERVWRKTIIKDFIRKKFFILVTPTFIFLFLFAFLFSLSYIGSLTEMKSGYWFTIALFEFFVLYIVSNIISKPTGGGKIDIQILTISIMLYLIGSAYRYYQLHSGDIWILDFIGIIHWRYYFFFVFGTLVKKYYSNFCQWMDNQYISAVIIILMVVVHFVVSRFFPIHQYNTVTFLIQGTLGIMIVFTFFRRYEDSFSKTTFIGKWLQYIGRRTLDIYLLHYFFLPRNVDGLGQFFFDYPNPVLEFFVSLFLALLVIVICLVTSNIIRLSPFLGHYLFGVRRE